MTKQRQVDKNIYLRGENQYQVKLMVAGRRISETFETLSEARVYRDKIRSDAALDPAKKLALTQRPKKREAAQHTLGKLLSRYVEEVSKAPVKAGGRGNRSWETNKHRLNKLLRYPIADCSVYSLSGDDIKVFYAALRAEPRGITDSTLKRYQSLIHTALDHARREWGLAGIPDPFLTVKKLRNGKPRKRRLENDEEIILARELALAPNLYVLPAWLFSLEVGLRQGEALNLRHSNVNLSDNTVFLPDTKNGESRHVALTPPARTILESLPKVHGDERLFPVSPNQVRGAWEFACTNNNIVNLRWHDMRREGASRLFEVYGLIAEEAALVTGHKTIKVLQDHYVALKAKRVAQKLHSFVPRPEDEELKGDLTLEQLVELRCRYIKAILSDHYEHHAARRGGKKRLSREKRADAARAVAVLSVTNASAVPS